MKDHRNWRKQLKSYWALSLVLIWLLSGCVRDQPEVIVITATFAAPAPTLPLGTLAPTPTMPGLATAQPLETQGLEVPRRHVVQPGDTLGAIAAQYGVSVPLLVQSNSLADPNVLEVGQVLVIPSVAAAAGSDFRIVPDSRLVRGPGSAQFNVSEFIAQQPGYIRTASDLVEGQLLTAAAIVERVALEFSVDARLLLALLELRGGWLRNPAPAEPWQTYPLGAGASPLGFDRNGLYRQLAWGADQLNRGYYGHKYENLSLIEFSAENIALRIAEVNSGTAGVQYMLSQFNTYANWQREISPSGLYATYLSLFGDPLAGALEPLLPPDLAQPALALPFPAGQTWYYTGGPHGGWGSGSAWAAVDFAPPDDLETVSGACYLSSFFATAVAPGVIARTAEGVAVLDLDGDGDEATGWSVLYLHLDATDRIAAGTVVRIGDPIGRPSCEGGVSSGTHLHIARRYNGEWLPADCSSCPPGRQSPAFVMGGWTFYGYPRQEYQGYALNAAGETRAAEVGRDNPDNQISG